MIVIGMAGRAGSGKDTVADRLVETHGFVKFSFSDSLYDEVQRAFNLPDQELLRNRATKEKPTPLLAPGQCSDKAFVEVVRGINREYNGALPLTPREVLQWYGTEYRRAQNPNYWLERAAHWMLDQRSKGHVRFVNTSVRFADEAEFVRSNNGAVWHVLRPVLPSMANEGHVSEKPLPIRVGDVVLKNVGSIADLNVKVDEAATFVGRWVA